MTTVNKNFKVKNGLQIDPLTTPGYLTNDASGVVSSLPGLATYVKNNTGSTLYKGQAVYVSSATGANALVSLASASSEATSSKTLGLLYQDLLTGDSGYVITNGTLTGVDTSTYSEGNALWLSNTAGAVTTTKVSAPNHLVYIGVVTRSHATVGEILVKVQNGYELDELHSVLITSPASGEVLKYNGTVWVNGTVSGSGGANQTVSDTAPSTPSNGDIWVDTTTMKSYIWYDSFWIERQSDKATIDSIPTSYGTAYGIITCGTSDNSKQIDISALIGATINTIYCGTAVDF